MKQSLEVPAQDWYESQSIGHGIFRIRETFIAHWLRCNIWLVRGSNKDLLIDSGLGLHSLAPILATITEQPITAVMTHCHFDHMGGAHEFRRRLGHKAFSDIYHQPMSSELDIGAFIRAETFRALPYSGFSIDQFSVTAAPLTGYLDEGDVIDLGNRTFQILHLPGHSPDSIALYEKNTEILFSGDAIYDGDLYDTVFHSDRAQYRQSLQRLSELPVSQVHGGHFGSFGNNRMQQIIELYLEGKGRIEDPTAWVDEQLSEEA